jgi:hypothetical protein
MPDGDPMEALLARLNARPKLGWEYYVPSTILGSGGEAAQDQWRAECAERRRGLHVVSEEE